MSYYNYMEPTTINLIISVGTAVFNMLIQTVALTVFIMKLDGRLKLIDHRVGKTEEVVSKNTSEIAAREKACITNHSRKGRS